MKKMITSFIATASVLFSFSQNNVGIGTSTPNSSAILDITSTNKGLLIPRMTTAQRTAIATPAKGLMVFDTDNNSFWYYNGSAWTAITGTGGSGSLSLPYSANVTTNTPSFKIENSGSGDVLYLGSTGSGATINAYSTSGNTVSTNSFSGYGVYATSWTNSTIYALSNNPTNTTAAIRANNTGGGAGIQASSSADNGIYSTTSAGGKAAVRGDASGTGAYGIYGYAASATGTGVYGTSVDGIAVAGSSGNNHGIKGSTSSNTGFAGVYGITDGNAGAGVQGQSYSVNTSGVYGASVYGKGVNGNSTYGAALYGSSSTGYGLEINGKVKIAGGNTNPVNGAVLTTDANGNAVWKNKPIAFKASGVTAGYTNLPGDKFTKVQFKQQDYDLGNNFLSFAENGNTSEANAFYPPVNGLYHFDLGVKVSVSSSTSFTFYAAIYVVHNGATTKAAQYGTYHNELFGFVSGSTDLVLSAGDKVYLTASPVAIESVNLDDWTDALQFSGHLVKEL